MSQKRFLRAKGEGDLRPCPRPQARSQIGTPLAHWGLHRGLSPAIAGDRFTPSCLSPGIRSGFQAADRSLDPRVQGLLASCACSP